MRRQIVRSLAAVPAAMLAPSVAQSQTSWRPDRTVDFIVPAGAGAALDTSARQMRELFDREKLLGVNMVVTNKPGGAGMVAMSSLQAKPGDGHQLVTLTHSSINNRIVGEVPLGYEDFTPLAILFDEAITVVVRADSPLKDVRDLAAALRKDPAALSVGVATSVGNHIHAAIAKPLKAAGVAVAGMRVVPFKSSAESMNNLLGGHIDVVSASAINVGTQLKAGRIRVLAVASAQRLGAELAHVPTWREQGIDAVYASSQGVLGARGLSAAQIGFWEGAFRRLSEMPDWQSFVVRNHWTPRFMGASEARAYLDAESVAARALLTELGLAKR